MENSFFNEIKKEYIKCREKTDFECQAIAEKICRKVLIEIRLKLKDEPITYYFVDVPHYAGDFYRESHYSYYEICPLKSAISAFFEERGFKVVERGDHILEVRGWADD